MRNRDHFGMFYLVSVEFERSLLYYVMQGKITFFFSMESAGFEEKGAIERRTVFTLA